MLWFKSKTQRAAWLRDSYNGWFGVIPDLSDDELICIWRSTRWVGKREPLAMERILRINTGQSPRSSF